MGLIRSYKDLFLFKSMRSLLLIFFIVFYSNSFSQTLSEDDIKQIAKQANDELQGVDLGYGIFMRNCLAFGRTLIYQYDVPEYWAATENMKEDLIGNFKEAGSAELFFNNDINVEFQYYYEGKLQKRITVKSNEFSDLTFSLGDYIELREHPKAKGVNMRIRYPNGWSVEDRDSPHIVKQFKYRDNFYMITITDNYTFISRNQAKELLSDDEFVDGYIAESCSFLNNYQVLNDRIVTIDTYPTVELTVKGHNERSGIDINMIMKSWVIMYEDKVITLQAFSTNEKEFSSLESLYHMITNSVDFPDIFK